ncbi:MAG: DnaA/Hda family protein [Chloroflexota bacterium]
MSPETAWKASLGELEMQMTRATFNTWLQGTKALSCEGDEFVIGVRNDFAKDWLENRLYDLIVRTLSSVVGRRVKVRFVVWSEELIAPKAVMTHGNGRAEVIREERPAGTIIAPDIALNQRYTFSSFVVGPNNRLAHAAALSVADNPGQTYNLCSFAWRWSGKTHLLHAIGHRCHADGYNVRHISPKRLPTNWSVPFAASKLTNSAIAIAQ